MRCSLLTLSTYLDGEFESPRRVEVEAHLVGCQRCRSGLEHLEEEAGRVAALAPVHVADHSLRQLLEQMGLMTADDVLPARTPAAPRRAEKAPPWLLAGVGSAALPWMPRREAEEDPMENQPALPFADVPLDQLDRRARVRDDAEDGPEVELNGRHVEAGDAAFEEPELEPEASLSPAVSAPPPPPPPPAVAPAPATEAPPLPPPVEAPGGVEFEIAPRAGIAAVSELQGAGFEAVAPRERAPEWPATTRPTSIPALISEISAEAVRLRDAEIQPPPRPEPVAGMEAIPAADPADASPPAPGAWHGLEGVDDDAWGWAPTDAVTAPAEPVEPAEPAWEPAAVTAAPDVPATLEEEPDADPIGAVLERLGPPRPVQRTIADRVRDQLRLRLALLRPRPEDDSVQIVSGVGAPPRSAPVRRPSRRAELSRRPASLPITPEDLPPVDDVAIAAGLPAVEPKPEDLDEWTPPPPVEAPDLREPSAEAPPWEPAPDEPVAAPARSPRLQPGRHTRALRAAGRTANRADVVGTVRRMGETALVRGRAAAADPRQRWVAIGALAALLLVAVIGLGVGRSSPSPASAPATGSGRAPAASAAAASAPAISHPTAAAPSAAPSQAPAVPAAITLGAGGSGWQVDKVRYGIHPGDYRIVFDMGAAGSSSASPTVVVGFASPTQMDVDFGATQPSGSAGALPPGGVATAVTMTTINGHVVYQYTLSHPVTVHAAYLESPLRLVVDLG
jgi:hypothetical protein